MIQRNTIIQMLSISVFYVPAGEGDGVLLL